MLNVAFNQISQVVQTKRRMKNDKEAERFFFFIEANFYHPKYFFKFRNMPGMLNKKKYLVELDYKGSKVMER